MGSSRQMLSQTDPLPTGALRTEAQGSSTTSTASAVTTSSTPRAFIFWIAARSNALTRHNLPELLGRLLDAERLATVETKRISATSRSPDLSTANS